MNFEETELNVAPSIHGEIEDQLREFNQADWVFLLEDLPSEQLQMAFNAICHIANEREESLVAEEL